MARRRVAVIGAGVVGANIAYRLSVRGAEVTVLDAGLPGRGTSSSSISWLSSFPQIANSVPSMVAYRQRTDERFRALQAEIGGTWVHWTGTLTWATGSTARRLERDYLAMRELGSGLRAVPIEELRTLDPAVSVPSGTTVYAEEDGGWVDAPTLVDTLLNAAAGHGADIRPSAAVTAMIHETDRWRLVTPHGELTADVIVNSAGIWASQVGALALAPIPLDLRPGLLVYSEPLSQPLRHVLNGTELNIRPDPSGGVAIHWRAEDTYTGHGYNAHDLREVLELASGVLPELRGTAPVRASVGVRPIPPGGPIIGWHPSAPDLFVAVSHGGVGWGPHWADIASAAIMDEEDDPRWSAFTPDRFFRSPRSEPVVSRHALVHVPAQM